MKKNFDSMNAMNATSLQFCNVASQNTLLTIQLYTWNVASKGEVCLVRLLAMSFTNLTRELIAETR